MPSRQSSKISEQNSHPDLQMYNIPSSPSVSNSEHPNLHNQAFIVYSDDQILSNSNSFNDNSFSLSHKRSSISSHSSCSSFDNFSQKDFRNRNNSVLAGLSQTSEESSVLELHVSECSDSGMELVHALAPLFKDNKQFLRRSPRFAEYATGAEQGGEKLEGGVGQGVSNNNKKQQQLDSEMIEDEKSSQSHQLPPLPSISSSYPNTFRIVQQPHDSPLSIFVPSLPHPLLKPDQPSPFARLTRSSKKLINEETQSSTQKNNNHRQSTIEGPARGSMSNNDYVSQMTKEYILNNRKEKRIKKMQQKQFQYGLRSFMGGSRNQAKGYGNKRGFN